MRLLVALALVSVTTAGPPALQVVYIPTPREVVTAMLEMAHVGMDDVVYDLGSGDGRICIAAVKDFGARRAVGIELDGAKIQESIANAKQACVRDRVEFRKQDLFEADLRGATVVTLYLSTEINRRLRPKFMRELRPGARIVSHVFDMGDWPPLETQTISGRPIYLWKM